MDVWASAPGASCLGRVWGVEFGGSGQSSGGFCGSRVVYALRGRVRDLREAPSAISCIMRLIRVTIPTRHGGSVEFAVTLAADEAFRWGAIPRVGYALGLLEPSPAVAAVPGLVSGVGSVEDVVDGASPACKLLGGLVLAPGASARAAAAGGAAAGGGHCGRGPRRVATGSGPRGGESSGGQSGVAF